MRALGSIFMSMSMSTMSSAPKLDESAARRPNLSSVRRSTSCGVIGSARRARVVTVSWFTAFMLIPNPQSLESFGVKTRISGRRTQIELRKYPLIRLEHLVQHARHFVRPLIDPPGVAHERRARNARAEKLPAPHLARDGLVRDDRNPHLRPHQRFQN